MALCVCKCLNICLQSDKTEDNIEIEKLELTPVEQRDNFFSELLLISRSPVKVVIAQPALSAQRVLARWTLHSCLACDITTHATMQEKTNFTLVNKSTLTTQNDINNMKKSTNFSQVFNILIPEVSTDVEMKENIDTNNVIELTEKKLLLPTRQAVGSLNKQLSQNLQTELEAMEEAVSQFRDQKYMEFEAYRERAHRDHKILSGIVTKAQSNLDIDGWKTNANTDKGPTSPQLPPLQRRRLSSFKDAKKYQQNKVYRNMAPEEDSLDVEDIFDLEGTDSNMSRNDMNSDQDDYDSDNSVSRDEGIHIVRGRNARQQNDIARSLPINMPKFSFERNEYPRDLDDEEEQPQDIAASIKALARSVHGDAYDLPRPRFSTQI